MKKTLVTLLLLTALCASAQTVKNQSIDFNLLGLEYVYEQPLSKKTTVKLHSGISGEVGYSSSVLSFYDDDSAGNHWFGSIRVQAGADFRYYYNITKRERKGKSIQNNTANFLAVDLTYYTPGIYEHNMDTRSVFIASPYWGLRRALGTNWAIEFHAGMVLGTTGSEFGWSPKVNVKVGYSF